MPNINIELYNKTENECTFEVEVIEGCECTDHKVTIYKKDYDRLTERKISPEKLVYKSFKFLLAREDQDLILDKFNLMDIQKYFPEYEKETTK